LSGALVFGVVAVLPAASVAAPSKAHHPRAKSAGGDVPPTLPSIVRVRISRGEASLARAADYVDRDMPAKATASLLNARRNMYAAWRGAKYLIEHAPPPPAAAARVHSSKKAHASGAPVGAGTVYADPNTTAVAVLGYQHDVATAAFGLLDGAKGTLENAVSTTIFAALDRRDSAIAYIAAIPPPPAADARVHSNAKAKASGAPVGLVPDFATLMAGIIPDLDDEMQQAEGLVNGGALTAAEKRIMNQADFQVFKTEQTVNTHWPPVPAEG
jgi:hypothetical protein